MREFFAYGERVDGYDERVVNEREARAGAGILFTLGLLSLTNATMLGHLIVTQAFITFFTLDFMMRVINPSYSPSLLLGRFFVRNQIPEYVGAAQKRFAWSLGLLLALPMFYMLVIDFVPNPIKVLICTICLALLLFESAFSICFGCMIYNLINKERSKNCPGGVCEVRVKDDIQKFNLAQKIIATATVLLLLYGIYAYITKVPSKTFFSKKVSKALMSEAELEALKQKKFDAMADKFFADDDDDE